MQLTRVKPFGKRRKTHFYAVAGFVLAGHVVVGGIFHVMPPELEVPEPGEAIEMQIVDHLLPDDVVESSAVRMIEEVRPDEKEEPQVFVPSWQPTESTPPALDPLGPSESVLPEVVVDEEPVEPEPEPEPATEADLEPEAGAGESPLGTPGSGAPAPEEEPSKPPVKKVATPEPAAAKPPVKKPSAPAKVVSKPPVKKPVPVRQPEPPKPEPPKPEPRPEPAIEDVPRAAPVEQETGRSGLLDRIRGGARPVAEEYVPANWSKRPPPYYPYEQLKRGIEGTAHVRVSIDSSGRITAARLVKSTGNDQLDEAALASVRKGIMNPARRGGRAVSSEMIVPFEFYQ